MSALTIAARLVCEFEGFSATPYRDTAGNWTIGYGTIRINGTPVTAHTPVVTRDQAMNLMEAELEPTAYYVDARVQVALEDQALAALYSLTYNIGMPAFGTSTLLRLLNEGDFDGAASQFLVWDKEHVNGKLVDDKGLLNRRKREMAIFTGMEQN